MKRAAMWVFWSPRNAVVTAVAIAAAVTVAISATAGGSEPTRATPAPTATTSSSTTTDAPAPDPSRVPRPTTSTTTATKAAGEQDEAVADTDQGRAVGTTARTFTDAWLTGRTGDRAEWLASMRKLTVPAFLPFVSATPPEAIPAATVKSITKPDLGDGIGTVTVTLSDGTTFDLDVIEFGKKWGVSSMTPR